MTSHLFNLRRLLSPPQPVDEDLALQALLLHTILIASFLGGVLYLWIVLLFLGIENYRLMLVLATMVGMLFLRMVLESGYIRETGLALCVFIWFILTFAAYTTGGVVSRAHIGYIILVVFGGLIFGRRGALVTLIVTAASGLAMIYLENIGWYMPAPSMSTASWWTAQVVFLAVAAALLSTATTRLRVTLDQLRHSEKQLVRANTELEQRVAERTLLLENQYQRQAALAQVELAINQTFELQTTLKQIVDTTSTFLPASAGASVVMWDSESSQFFTSASNVTNTDNRPTAVRVRKEGGATRWVIDEGKPIIVPDIDHDPFGANEIILESGIKAYVGVPLRFENAVIGVLYALDRQPRDYSTDDVNFLNALANRAAVAITRVRLYGQIEKIATQEERQRLARDLHDVVSQTLFSASIIAESLPRLWHQNPTLVHGHLDDLHYLTRSALAEMRALLLELRPADLEHTELGKLLHQLGTGFYGRTRIPVNVKINEKRPLPIKVKMTFYRITQEAFNNIRRHAGAREVWIDFISDDSQAFLSIRDDGKGFETDRIPPNHLGLQIMKERADGIGAGLTITSRPGEGTLIACEWISPVEDEVHSEILGFETPSSSGK